MDRGQYLAMVVCIHAIRKVENALFAANMVIAVETKIVIGMETAQLEQFKLLQPEDMSVWYHNQVRY